jgi:hypothetical protein
MRTALVSLAAGLALAPAAFAQSRFLFIDRSNGVGNVANRLFTVDDGGAGVITSEATQLSVFWSTENAAGTQAMATPQGLAFRPYDGTVAVGDNGVKGIFLMRDINRNGTAQDPGESYLAASPGNASGVVLNVQGLAFDSAGNIYASSAFNSTAGSVAAIYKLTDTDPVPDGRFNSAGEIVTLVGASYMGASSSHVPFAIAIDNSASPPVGYWKSSASTANAGVHRFDTVTGAAAPFITSANASGVPVGAALTMCLDATRSSAVYFTQTVSSIRQVVRARDLSSPADGDAQDAGEAAVVWATAETMGIADIISLADGRVMLTDTPGTGARKIVVLTPTGDTFNGYAGTPFTAGQGYSLYYASSGDPAATPPTPGTIRHIVAVPHPCQANCDDSTTAPVLNVADFTCFLQKYSAGDLYGNCDGSTASPILNVADFTCFLQKFSAGCP